MDRVAFGVDVGGTTVKLGLFSVSGELLKKWEIATRTQDQGKNILPDVASSIQSVIEKERLSKENIIGVGIGTPGAVDAKGTVHGAGNLNWGTFNIPEVLGDLLSLPVRAGNDANVAAFGEMWQGGGKGCKNIVMVTLGTGVGGGIIAEGNIVTGVIGAGGEIGHIHIEDNEQEVCCCGCKGCLEQYASATGIVRLAKRRLAGSDMPSSLRGLQKITAKAVFDAVKKKDALAIEIAEDFGKYLGKGLAIAAALLNPEVFVVGGGVSKAGEIIFEYIRPYYEKYAFGSIKNTQFRLANLGNDAGIYGAAGLVINDVMK